MSVVFADTFYFLGLTKLPGKAHTFRMDLVTGIGRAAAFLESLSADQRVKIVPLTAALFDRGRALYEQHADKEWSLTDCISFVTMRDERIVEAATGDHHFEQAGFTALLK